MAKRKSTEQWLIAADGTGYENPDWRPTPENYERAARVYESEASRRAGDPFAETLLTWAANWRRKAAKLRPKPKQLDLFNDR